MMLIRITLIDVVLTVDGEDILIMAVAMAALMLVKMTTTMMMVTVKDN